MRFLGELRVFLRPKDYLRQTFPIPQVDEDHATMIARDVNPTGECDLFADVDLAQRIAIVGAVHAKSL